MTFKVREFGVQKLRPMSENPRMIDDERFEGLKESLKEFPEMLRVRPIIVDDDMNILCGNMRYYACVELGMKSIPAVKMSGLSDDEKVELMIKDNVHYGEWDFGGLDEKFSDTNYKHWMGVDVEDEVDLDGMLDELYKNYRRSIQIDCAECDCGAVETISLARKAGIDVGDVFLELLNELYPDE